MDELVMNVRYFDALSGQSVEIPVSIEIGTYIKRSYWREDMQERRYYKRKVDIDLLSEDMADVWEERDSMINREIRHYEVRKLRELLSELTERERILIRVVYDEERTVPEAAKELGVSDSYAYRLIKKMKADLRNKMQEFC